MSGANAYWLGLDENVGGIDYPTYFRIKDALDTASQMGVTAVRSHMMTSTGQNDANPLAIMPSLGSYNDDAFATIDFAIAYAGSLGIRLLLPLTDEWEYYHGGHRDFTAPLGLESADFYTDPAAIAAFDEYIGVILDRTNAITGVRYVDDPTILAWELGNELEGMTVDWIGARVDLIKSLAPAQLVAAGGRFGVSEAALHAPDLDIVDAHYYPPTVDRVASDAASVVAAGKVYVAGEYGSPAATTALLYPLAANPDVTGMFFWSLFPNNDRGGFVPHDDGFTVHYPGETAQSQAEVDAIVGYGAALSGAAPATDLEPALVTAIDRENGINRVAWRGTAGATGYTVQSSTDGTTWTDITAPVSAAASPITDYTSAPGTSYRVLALGGLAGSVSEPVTASGQTSVLVDPLQSFLLTSDRAYVTLAAMPMGAIATGTAGSPAQLTWPVSDLTSAEFLVSDAIGMTVSSSADGNTWVVVATSITTRNGHSVLRADDLVGEHLRLDWANGATVTRATIASAPAGDTAVALPGGFALDTPADGTTGVRSTPTFTWAVADQAAFYRFTLSLNADLSEPLQTQTGITATEFAPGRTLAPGTAHYWSVEAVNGAGATGSTPPLATFTTADLPSEPLVVDDFEGYPTDQALTDAYLPNSGGGAVTSTLVANPGTGSAAASFDYDLAGEGYAGIVRTLETPQDWWGYSGLSFWVDADTGHTLSVQFAASGSFWETDVVLTTDGWQQVEVDFTDFATPPWAGQATLNLSSVTEHAFYLGGSGSGTLLIDDLSTVLADVPTAVDPTPTPVITPALPDAGDPAVSADGGTASTAGTGTAGGLALTGTTGVRPLTLAAIVLLVLGAALRTRRRTV
nr:carbohydrate binding domain-containing protein [Cryobacterium roopkundense]